MSLQGKQVTLIRDLPGLRSGIQCGLTGRCEWDEGGDEVIVEFGQEVPNGSMLPNKKQAWVPRDSLKITQ